MDQGLAMAKEPALQQKFDFEFPLGRVYEHIDLNRNHPGHKDKRVRQALLLGIDRETLVKQLVDGKFPVAHSWVNPLEPGYDAMSTKYPFDPATRQNPCWTKPDSNPVPTASVSMVLASAYQWST
jgi:peptide/nickel transport system substrate-binding protein